MSSAEKTLQNINYQVFMVSLSMLALLNAGAIFLLNGAPAAGVLAGIDAWLTPLFMFDFALRLISARSKWRYFFLQFGWADLLGSLWLPGLDGLRVFRIYRTISIIRQIPASGGGHPWRTMRRERANSVLGSMILLAILVLEIGGVAVLYFEDASPKANIHTAGDALWWGIVTIATVGYGDYYPVTQGGRTVGTLEIVTGVVVFGTISGFLANAFISRRRAAVEPDDAADPQALLAEVKRLAAELEQRQTGLETRLSAEQDRRAVVLETRLARIEALLSQTRPDHPDARPPNGPSARAGDPPDQTPGS